MPAGWFSAAAACPEFRMETVIIVIHLMVVIALVAVVLVQRSEGGGLGIGGGSGFMTARGAANALTRTTAILAAIFFATSLGLSIMARYQGSVADILDNPPASSGKPVGNSGGGKGILDKLGGAPSQAPASNTGQQPAVPNSGGSTTAPATNEAPAAGAPATPTPSTQVPSGSGEPANGQKPAEGGNTGQAPAQPQVPNQ
jgi:preprotein translocase subunit SecG